jgi:hypothetical protein
VVDFGATVLVLLSIIPIYATQRLSGYPSGDGI